MAINDPDRLFPPEPSTRAIARALYESVCDLPVISPHGHCNPQWFAQNKRFPNPSELFIIPDHYIFRMLASRGVTLADLGIPAIGGEPIDRDPVKTWRLFAEHIYLFRGTPSAMWLDHVFEHVFNLDEPLSTQNAERHYEHIDTCLSQPEFKPRALFDRFNIEFLATTESALDDLSWHGQIRDSDWSGRVVSTYRPDSVVDPEHEGYTINVARLGDITGEDTSTWQGYLNAHRIRREYFKKAGTTATDHGHPTARTADLPTAKAAALFEKTLQGECTAEEADLFRGQMLTEMARMSLDDGLTLQIHPGACRNYNQSVFQEYGRDMGFDIPTQTDYVSALKPLLNAVGMETRLNVVLFTLDETTYSRELAPLAGAFPALRLGPPWWFFDSFEGIKRFRENVTETCGFYNTAGFNDDTRAFCSIPARHDVARRSDCAYLATLVTTGRLRENEAFQLATDLTVNLAKETYHV